jgi:hypothetical protein
LFRWALTTAFVLLLSGVARNGVGAEPPHINKPRPAPADLPPNIPPLPPAVFDKTLAIGGSELKAREIDTRLSVDVQVNGRGPYRFVVDSGADTSAVGLRIAHDLELPLGTPAILNGTTSRDVVDRVRVDNLNLGPATIHDLELPALRELDMGGDGMLGIDALERQRLMMDFEKHLIKVEDASQPLAYSRGDIVIIARRRHGQLILTEVEAAGLPLDAVIDTGSEVTIGNLALRDKLIRGNRDKFVTVDAIGVTGVHAKLQVAKIAELQLGPVMLHDIPIAFADVPPFKMFGLINEPALLLGTDILQNFRRVSLDFRARKVRFQLRSCKTEGVFIGSNSEDSFGRISPTSRDPDLCGRF